MNESPYKALYLQEMSERLSGIEKGLLSLESSPGDKTVVDALFRHYHSVKGMSASMGYDPIKDFAHLQEDVLEGFRSAGSFPARLPSPSSSNALTRSKVPEHGRKLGSAQNGYRASHGKA